MTTIKTITASNRSGENAARNAKFRAAFSEAVMLLEMTDLEPRSALKEAGAAQGIEWGDEMGAFVLYAEQRLGIA